MMILGAAVAAAAPAEARTRGHGVRTPRIHAAHVRTPRPHKPHNGFRSVRVRRADGSVLSGYRDSLGTHLRGADGRSINCQRQIGAADIDIACR